MRTAVFVISVVGGITAASSAFATQLKENRMPAPIVFFDIAGPDLAAQADFYRKVFGWDVAADGRFSAPTAAALAGALRADPPDKLLYIGVNDVAATLKVIVANGGRVVAPRFEIKGVAVLGLFTDPAGNRLGLVEMSGGVAKIP